MGGGSGPAGDGGSRDAGWSIGRGLVGRNVGVGVMWGMGDVKKFGGMWSGRGSGVRVDVNEELKFFVKIQKINRGGGGGGAEGVGSGRFVGVGLVGENVEMLNKIGGGSG